MDNKSIAKVLNRYIDLLELHETAANKISTYKNAVFQIEKWDQPLAVLEEKELTKISGIGNSIAGKISEINATGSFSALEDLSGQTPEGVLELLQVPGIGPKKIASIWKQLNITRKEELLKACEEDQLEKLKGFGKASQEKIYQSLLFFMKNEDKFLYAEAVVYAHHLEEFLVKNLNEAKFELTGQLRRRAEVIEYVQVVVGSEEAGSVFKLLDSCSFIEKKEQQSGPFVWRGKFIGPGLRLEVIWCAQKAFSSTLFMYTGSEKHLGFVTENGKTLLQIAQEEDWVSESAIYEAAQLPYVEPEMREGLFEFELEKGLDLIAYEDLKGVLHNHTTYSDGKHSLREMAEYARGLGYEYLGITDHSKSSYFYANGMYEKKVMEQQEEIDALNKEMAPFKIFKGIEVDILPDGSLDYHENVLQSFDFTIASVHSNLTMPLDKATDRLLKAIENPYTTMLGHPTGRLLLRRNGYPIDHKKIIDACAEHNVMIEINANPHRLDLDWRWIPYALERGVKLSVNPDAHQKEGYHDMYFGVLIGRKGGLTKKMTFNTLGVDEVTGFFQKRKQGITA